MTFTITVHAQDIQFSCRDGETLLDAAERSSYAIPYSCRKGVCASCAGEIVRGKVMVSGRRQVAGPAADVLLCQARPTTDIEFRPARIYRNEMAPRKVVTAKVHRIDWPTRDVAIVKLRFANGIRAVFDAGQYLQVRLPSGETRNYSMANPPQQNTGAELHVRRVRGGAFSDEMLATLEKGSLLDVELPFGEFTAINDDNAGMLLLATGTGYAPIKSIVEEHIRERRERPMHFFWGGRKAGDLYDSERIEDWARQYDWFRYTPVLSQPSEHWPGFRGYVQDAALKDYPDMSNLTVYACGSSKMIDESRQLFTDVAKLAIQDFRSDAFVSSGNIFDEE